MILISVCSNDGVFDVALHVHVQAYSNGRVTWTPPALYCSSCGVKVNINTPTHTKLSLKTLFSFYFYSFHSFPPKLTHLLCYIPCLCLGNIFPI